MKLDDVAVNLLACLERAFSGKVKLMIGSVQQNNERV